MSKITLCFMVRNRFLLGSVAFGISFGISWLTTRDVSRAMTTGFTTLSATVIAAVVVDRRFQTQANQRIATLKSQIRALQKQRGEAYRALQTLQVADLPKSAERDLQTTSVEPAYQLPPAPRVHKPLSWNLSAPVEPRLVIDVKPHELPTELQLRSSETENLGAPSLEKVLADAAVTKQKIETKVRSLQTELGQLQKQVEQHRQSRDRLVHELADLERQKQQLQTEASGLKQKVNTLKQSQRELDQYVSQAEARKQEVEIGTHPLHTAVKQMQTQVGSLQEELNRLEHQVSDRRRQKIDLEQQLAALKAQPSTPSVYSLSATQDHRSNGHSYTGSDGVSNPSKFEPPSKPATIAKPALAPRPTMAAAVTPGQPIVEHAPTQAGSAQLEKTSELGHGWEEFMLALPEYEFLVLKAIAEQSNPGGFIKKIAEDNLTMPELLIDSINERALETVGDMVVEPGTDTGRAAIVREHAKIVKKLIKTYEYLAE